MKKLFFSLIVAVAFTSCYNSKVMVGSIPENKTLVKVKSVTNHQLILGLVPLTKQVNAKNYVGNNENYVVRVNHSLINLLVEGITGGIYTPTTTTFYIPAE